MVETLADVTDPVVDNGILELLISDEKRIPVEASVPILIAVEMVSVTEVIDVGKAEDISEVLSPIELTLESKIVC